MKKGRRGTSEVRIGIGHPKGVEQFTQTPGGLQRDVVYTVKKVDELVRHLHLVTQDQFRLVSKKYSDSHEDNCIKNIEVFQQTFTNVELLRYKHIPNVELFR